jgi:hypothetical protein
MPRRIVGIEFVEEAVAALGYSTELATHLFRECWSGPPLAFRASRSLFRCPSRSAASLCICNVGMPLRPCVIGGPAGCLVFAIWKSSLPKRFDFWDEVDQFVCGAIIQNHDGFGVAIATRTDTITSGPVC